MKIIITKDNYKEYENIEKVKGNLVIDSNVELKELKSVGKYLSIYSNAELIAHKLKSVGGYLYISSKARVTFKKLNHIEGKLYIDSKAKLNLSPKVEAYFIAKNI